MTKHNYRFFAAAALLALFSAPAFSAVNPDGGIDGVEIGTPVQKMGKDGKIVWDICIGPMPCLPGQIKIAKSAEEEACMADPSLCDLTKPLQKLAAIDPKAGIPERPAVASSGLGVPPDQIGCDSSEDRDCTPKGQQMGGGKDKKKKGQQMGPRFKKFKKGLQNMVDKGLSW